MHTQDQTYEADTIIIAAGAWTQPLAGHLVPLPELTVTQISAFHFVPEARHGQSAAPAPAAWPTFIHYGDVVRYGLLSGADAPGAVKVAVHGMGRVTTGDDRDGIPDKAVREQARSFVMTKVPGLQPEPVKELTCLYTSTANEDFIFDRRDALVIVSACSGHGAKFAPLTGRIAADLVAGHPAPHARFALPTTNKQA